MLSARGPAPFDAAGIFADDPAATFFRFGKAARVQRQIFETGSQIQLALIKHGQNLEEKIPLTRLRGRSHFGAAKARRCATPSPRPAGRDFPDRKMSRIEPLNRSRRRESALAFVGLKVRGLIPQCGTATRFRGGARLFLFVFNPSFIRS
jgi:hypothetical protein